MPGPAVIPCSLGAISSAAPAGFSPGVCPLRAARPLATDEPIPTAPLGLQVYKLYGGPHGFMVSTGVAESDEQHASTLLRFALHVLQAVQAVRGWGWGGEEGVVVVCVGVGLWVGWGGGGVRGAAVGAAGPAAPAGRPRRLHHCHEELKITALCLWTAADARCHRVSQLLPLLLQTAASQPAIQLGAGQVQAIDCSTPHCSTLPAHRSSCRAWCRSTSLWSWPLGPPHQACWAPPR